MTVSAAAAGRSARATTPTSCRATSTASASRTSTRSTRRPARRRRSRSSCAGATARRPTAASILYYEDKQLPRLRHRSGSRATSPRVPASFVNVEDDHNVVDPPTHAIGWSLGQRVGAADFGSLGHLADSSRRRHAPSTSRVNGRKDQIRYQRRLALDPRTSERGHRPREAAVLRGDGEWTKQRRLRRARAGQARHQDAALGGRRSRGADEGRESRRLDLHDVDADRCRRDYYVDRRHAREAAASSPISGPRSRAFPWTGGRS